LTSELGEPTPVVADGLFRISDDGIVLLAGECGHCAELTFPEAIVCPNCQSQQVRTVELPTSGVLYSFTVVRSRPPDYAGAVPYGYGLVELDGKIRLASMIVSADYDALQIGAAVELVGIDVGGPERLLSYAFRDSARESHG
jgi:uncharacterized OB-fold protein